MSPWSLSGRHECLSLFIKLVAPESSSKTSLVRMFVADADPRSSSLQPYHRLPRTFAQTSIHLRPSRRKWAPYFGRKGLAVRERRCRSRRRATLYLLVGWLLKRDGVMIFVCIVTDSSARPAPAALQPPLWSLLSSAARFSADVYWSEVVFIASSGAQAFSLPLPHISVLP